MLLRWLIVKRLMCDESHTFYIICSQATNDLKSFQRVQYLPVMSNFHIMHWHSLLTCRMSCQVTLRGVRPGIGSILIVGEIVRLISFAKICFFLLYANLAVSKFISLLTYQSISEFRNPPFSLSLSIDCRALNPHNNIPPATYLSNHWPTLVAHKVSACQWTYKLCSYKNSWMGGLAVTFHWDTFLRQHHHHHGTSHKDWTGERV